MRADFIWTKLYRDLNWIGSFGASMCAISGVDMALLDLKVKFWMYTVMNYNKIYLYLEDGRSEIDNNLIENSIRPVALGRKNYLFAESHAGAQRAAIVYSLLGSCRWKASANKYLQDVLLRLPEGPINQLKDLLPPFWKPVNLIPIPEI
jgi:hypothetical protein